MPSAQPLMKPMEHKSSAIAFHLVLFFAVFLHSIHVMLFSFSSAIHVLLQLYVEQPILHIPCGFHSSATLAIFPASLVSVFPIHVHNLFFTSVAMGSFPVDYHKSSFHIISGHLMPGRDLDLVHQCSC